MDNPVISHDFVRTLSKKIRAAFGKEVPHTQVLDMIAESLNWRTDALMHKLKAVAGAKPAQEAPENVSDETLRQWVVLRSWRRVEQAAVAHVAVLPPLESPVYWTDTQECVAAILAVSRVALGDVQGAFEAIEHAVSRHPGVNLARFLVLYKRDGETPLIREALRRICRSWPDVKELVRYPRSHDVENLGSMIAGASTDTGALGDWEWFLGHAFSHLSEPGFLGFVHRTFVDTIGIEPKVSADRSVGPDGIACLFDGERRKMLKMYLETKYGMTPEDYRAYWGLPADYPMVASGYAAEKAAFASGEPGGPKH